MSGFHDVRLPLAFSLGATGGPTWRTEIVQLASGREFRNSQWSMSRRRWDIGGAVKSAEDLAELTAFFETCRGRLYGFRLRDVSDYVSAESGMSVQATDQLLGLGDGALTEFQLVKRSISGGVEQVRRITRPVAASVRIGVNDVEQLSGWSVDATTGRLSFINPPPQDAQITAGFEFDIPVRFDADQLEISMDVMGVGRIVSAPVIELLE